MSDGGGASAPSPDLPDLLYVVRPGDDNEELRWSLRSVAQNLPHRKVWIAGHCPEWVTGVIRLELPPLADKFANQRQSLTAAVNQDGLSHTFLLMNDDMFVCQSVSNRYVPAHHLGPFWERYDWLVSLGKKNDWMDAIAATAMWSGTEDMYECHTPLPFRKHLLRQVLADYPLNQPFAAGEVYELAGVEPGVLGIDVKNNLNDTPFLSSVDHTFAKGEVGQYVRNLFPSKCRYES